MSIKRIIQKIIYILYLHRDVKIKTEECGTEYGGFNVAADYIKSKNPIVYSFGIGEDISFDIAVIEKYNAKVYGFDPTPKSIKWVSERQKRGWGGKVSERFSFLPYGIAVCDGKVDFYLPQNENHVSGSVINRGELKGRPIEVEMYSLSSIMKMMGHDTIDILKMDVEGSEFEVIPNILENKIEIGQICMEVHGRFIENGYIKTIEMIKQLKKAGYRICHISNSKEEITFIKC